MRILWQSLVSEESSSVYLGKLRQYVNEFSLPGVDVDVVGMDPPARGWSRLSELRGAVHVVTAAIHAERAGYDAFVIGHFQEPGLYEARSTVGIPVIGLGEAVLLWSAHLGRRLGLVSVDSVFESIHLEQAQSRGLGERVVGVRALEATLEEFEKAFSPEGYHALRERFLAQASDLIDMGADVLVPAGGLFAMASAHEENFNIDGVPVVPSVLIALEWAQMTARIHQFSGVRPSTRSTFRQSPKQAIDDFLATTERDSVSH